MVEVTKQTILDLPHYKEDVIFELTKDSLLCKGEVITKDIGRKIWLAIEDKLYYTSVGGLYLTVLKHKALLDNVPNMNLSRFVMSDFKPVYSEELFKLRCHLLNVQLLTEADLEDLIGTIYRDYHFEKMDKDILARDIFNYYVFTQEHLAEFAFLQYMDTTQQLTIHDFRSSQVAYINEKIAVRQTFIRELKEEPYIPI